MSKIPTALIILDGFGYRENKKNNVVAQAHMPHMQSWWRTYPHALLRASGTAVGLPDTVMGNSEVGHLTIGAGRIITQPITLINNAITDGSFFTNPILTEHLQKLARTGNTLHLMGLLSDGQVHSHSNHLYALLDAARQAQIDTVMVHAFLDGRDTPPRSAQQYLERTAQLLKEFPHGSIGSLHGRFYAMDRDNNWDRTQKSYDVLSRSCTDSVSDWRTVLHDYYAQNISDEFIPPTQLAPDAHVHAGDGIIFFNTRPDRARQLTACFVDSTFKHFPVTHCPLTFFITPVTYDTHLATTPLFDTHPVPHTLKQVVSAAEKTIFAIAETEKYAHITYFLSGGTEEKFPGETRVLIPSHKLTSYADDPCMSAVAITDAVIASLNDSPCDMYIINYANADMVGHSGNFDATVKALECLDTQLGRLYELIMRMNGTLYITADHGKAEEMYDDNLKQAHTAHTANLVPFIMIRKDQEGKARELPLHELSDIAPFILHGMGLAVPKEMRDY